MSSPAQGPRIAVIGAGLGGAVAGALLQRRGFVVDVFDQATAFERLGAGINVSPNILKVYRALGFEDAVVDRGSAPPCWASRDGVGGDYLARIPLGDFALKTYGARYVTVHRGDLHAFEIAAIAPGTLHFGKRLERFVDDGGGVDLFFADGERRRYAIVIGADGIKSRIRATLLGEEVPEFGGTVAYRALIPAERIRTRGVEPEACVKWWFEDRHLMTYFTSRAQDEYYVVTGVPHDPWTSSASFVASSRDEIEAAFAGCHPTVATVLAGIDTVTKWPLMVQRPLPLWSRGRVVMMGDACHPMKPHMGQGAAMAIEDAAVLARCIAETGLADHAAAFRLYEHNRKHRTSRVQRTSNGNRFLKYPEDPAWVFGYDAMTVPLDAPANRPDTSIS